MTSIGTLQHRLIAQLKHIDKEFRPLKELFAKDPKKYMAQWRKYIKQTAQCVDEFKSWLDYYPTLAEEEANASNPRSRKLKTASVDLARTATKLENEIGGEFQAHFANELKLLKSRHKDYSNALSSLDTSSPDAFSKSFKNIARDLPKNIKEELKALPYKHPATLYLKLTPEQYNELNRVADRKKLEKHENISSVSLKKVMSYVANVYRERHSTDYSHICIALQLATGRRRAELGLLSKITPSENLEKHITIDRFAKSNNIDKVYDLPVVFLTVAQVIELHTLLRELLDNVVFADKKVIWEEIKRKGDTDRFDDYTKRVRITFLNEFKIRGFDVPESDAETLTVHNACRSIYAQYAYLTRQASYRKMSLLAFANRVLGHARGDYKATENYLRVELIDDRFDSSAVEKPTITPSATPMPPPSQEDQQGTTTVEMDEPTKEASPRKAPDPFKSKQSGKSLTAPSQEIQSSTEPSKPASADTAVAPLETTTQEREGSAGRTAPSKTPGPSKPKSPDKPVTAPSAKTQKSHPDFTERAAPIKSTLTATPWKAETDASGKKRTPPKPKSVAKAPTATRKFFEAVRSQDFITDLMSYSLKIKEPGLLDIQRYMNIKLNTVPTLEDLRAIAPEKTVALYLKFLKKHRIKHAIDSATP